ncbi:hypothetical protein [Dysgonomonas sp. 511]|uniref:hypothetical protein n=1 Tax=Dysgonomonas sp. 511 TaxID=2302930 RepID=UPI0013D53C0E|nr:hypothetical protein [Dysgonomonas sp. 511]NDV78753.1 hypothetical protein [Dysgonomonas sp. 511]
MISPVIKEKLEYQLGKEIRYPSDCEHLSFDIEKCTKQRVSTNTLKRLLGFIDGVKEPRLYTLDAIARYINHKNWDELLESLVQSGNSSFTSIEEIDIQNISIGTKIRFTYSPDRIVTIEYIGDNKFSVIDSLNSKLIVNDIIEVSHFVLNYPLIVSNVIRNDISIGKFTAGKISGITSLSIL